MSRKNPKVLILATSRKTRGGITSVIKAHLQGEQWKKYHCRWIETHRDGNYLRKLWYLMLSMLEYVVILPFYDLVHIHLSEPPSAIRKLPFLLYAKLIGKKAIVHFHSYSIETTIHSKFDFIYKDIFTKADLIIVLSQFWKDEVYKKFKLDNKIKVLYNPCGKPDYTTKFDKEKIILYAGILNSRKGYNDLIDAFSKIADNYPEWKLYLAGNGEIEKALFKVKSYNLQDQIKILGWIDGQEKSKYFQEASIFCLPSYAEGFPMAVLDAWAYGIPVITTLVGGIPDIVQEGINGLLFPAGDIEKLSKLLEKLIQDKGLRESIVSESNKLVNDVFNVNVINVKLDRMYCKIMKQ
jgi:glycosyltransferase involved in cell wall biosynthesis